MSFDREQLAEKLQALATQGIFLGTSSWKYPGWFGTVYNRDRYIWRGRYSKTRFERNCLGEFARTFPAVSVDATYYRFYERSTLEELAAQVPQTFQFALKVCGGITLKRFPQLARFGHRAGMANSHFLDTALFTNAFLEPVESIRSKVGMIMFEFSRFGPADFERGAAFVETLDSFLESLPRGWPYAVEIRNRKWLRPEYFAVLARHSVTHIYNAWADTPPVLEQLSLPGSETNPALLAARLLLREGRTYEQAVKEFSPYSKILDPNPEGRKAAVGLVKRGLASKGKANVMVLVGNRFEGHSPGTINAIVQEVESEQSED